MAKKSWSAGFEPCEVMTACVIVLNMIVEDEREDEIFDQGFQF